MIPTSLQNRTSESLFHSILVIHKKIPKSSEILESYLKNLVALHIILVGENYCLPENPTILQLKDTTTHLIRVRRNESFDNTLKVHYHTEKE